MSGGYLHLINLLIFYTNILKTMNFRKALILLASIFIFFGCASSDISQIQISHINKSSLSVRNLDEDKSSPKLLRRPNRNSRKILEIYINGKEIELIYLRSSELILNPEDVIIKIKEKFKKPGRRK